MLDRLLISIFPVNRQRQLDIKHNAQDRDWIKRFLVRSRKLKLRKYHTLEQARQKAMSVRNLGAHSAPLEIVMRKYSIKSPSQVFNLNEIFLA